jgi:membrane protein DedA with SNARE-associated domain
VLLTAVGILLIASNAGSILLPSLVKTHPAVLITLTATNRALIAATNQLDAATYYGIGFVRLLLADPLFYLLGLFYGDAAIRWVERKMGEGATTIIWFEKAFKKARYPIVLLAPNNPVCLLAGATGMPVPVFLALNTIGTVGRLYLIRVLGETFNKPINAVTGFLDEYRWPLVGVSLALFVLQSLLKKQQGKAPGELGALAGLKEEIEASEAGDGAPPEKPGVDDLP